MATVRLSGTLTALIVALTVTAAVAAACGDDDGYGGSSTNPTAPAGSTSAAQSGPSSGEVVKVRDSSLGKILSDGAGMTLYTFKNDAPGSGKSACTGACATAWPPLTTSATTIAAPAGVTGALATITRDDGKMQATYQGQPLYHYAADSAPGDTKGNGVGGVWSVVLIQAAGGATPTAAGGYGAY